MNPHARHAAYVLAAYAASAIGLSVLGLSSALRAHKWRGRAEARRATRETTRGTGPDVRHDA